MTSYAAFIDNQFHAGEAEALVVQNPATGAEHARLNGASIAQVERAILSARAAFDSGSWSGLSRMERAAILRRFAAALASRAQAITDLVVAEAGCPRYAPVIFAQVAAPLTHANEIIDLYLALPETEENPLPFEQRISMMGSPIQSVRRYGPVGVVAAIAAYNYPFYTAMWKVMPALVAGNSVILRPSPLTPLSAMIFADAAQEAQLPPGVLNVILESGIEGAQLLTTHRAVDMVAFTGSTAVGKTVMIQASDTMKRLQLELGGKSAQIFLPDAVGRVAAVAASICTAHAGQGCALGTRIFVPEESKQQVLDATAAAFDALVLGDTESRETQVGPVISAAQVDKCERFVRLAVESGGRVVAGGARGSVDGGGHYFRPTLLDLPDNDNPAAQEEIFGPVVSVIGYRDLDHAVAMANDSRYGLSSYVYGADNRAALKVAARIKAGTVNVNAGLFSSFASSGGQRESGYGRERGVEGIRLYQELTCINIGG